MVNLNRVFFLSVALSVAIIVYTDLVAEVFSVLPITVRDGAFLASIVLLFWISAWSTYIEEESPVTNPSIWVFITSFVLALFVGLDWGATVGIGIAGPVFAIVFWVFGFFVFSGITLSIRGVDPTEQEQKRRRNQTSDPYGDKHAARILNNNN